MEKNFTIKKVDISDIENISEKKSLGVSKKFSLGIFFGILFIGAISFIGVDNFSGASANILSTGENLHGSPDLVDNISNLNSDIVNSIYLFLAVLFFTIYILYVFAKMELQRFGEQNIGQKDFATRNFPSIYILETMTMLYVLTFVVLSFYLIQQINFETAFDTFNSSIKYVANFALFGGSLSSLFFFLYKVRPGKFDVNGEESSDKKLDFDINRVLKYLSFPFMSAGMGVVSFLIIMGTGDILGIDSLKDPSGYFIILLAVMAGYFCDAFVMFFHSIFKAIESALNKRISK